MKNKKTKILITIIIILVILIIASLIYIAGHQKDPAAQPDDSGTSTVSLKVTSYTSYRPDTVDFAYILANVDVNPDTQISLEHFTTSENIRLDETDDYLKLLQSQGIDTSLFEDKHPLDKNHNVLFIPVKDKDAEEIDVKSDISSIETMHFTISDDVTPSPQSSATPEPEETTAADTTVVRQDDMQIAVSRIFEIDPASCLQNGSEAMLPSSARVFAAEIEVQDINQESITIDQAEYDTDNGQAFMAEDSSFSSSEYTTAIGSTLHQGDRACVYFILIGNGETDFSYNGTLKLSISGIDGTINAETTLS